MASNHSSAFEITLTFLLGTATGFILGVLFAPASGEETRKKIREEAEKAGIKAREEYERLSQKAEKGIKTAKEKGYEGIDALKDFVERKKEEISHRTVEGSSENTQEKE